MKTHTNHVYYKDIITNPQIATRTNQNFTFLTELKKYYCALKYNLLKIKHTNMCNFSKAFIRY